MLLVTINKPASAVNVRARWSKSVMLYDAWEKVIYIRYSLYSQSVRTHTSPLLPCHKLNDQSKIVFISLEGNWKIIKNVSSPSHCASVFVLAFSHLKIPSEPNLFFSSCSRSWKFVLLGVERCLHTVGYNKTAPSTFFFSTGVEFWMSLELYRSHDWWRRQFFFGMSPVTFSVCRFDTFKVDVCKCVKMIHHIRTIRWIDSVGVMSSHVGHVFPLACLARFSYCSFYCDKVKHTHEMKTCRQQADAHSK